jgi:hypothetical protein
VSIINPKTHSFSKGRLNYYGYITLWNPISRENCIQLWIGFKGSKFSVLGSEVLGFKGSGSGSGFSDFGFGSADFGFREEYFDFGNIKITDESYDILS